ncbi:MAG: mechanosensitive ion channel [Saprospiraceae bacterium]|nr:mechanosensitive ion channel [Saprospiraceae bacterium]
MKNLLNGSLTEGLSSMLTSMLKSVPSFLLAIGIIVLGIIISKIVANLVDKVLSKIGIDKLGDKLNEIELVQKMNTEVKISKVFSKIIYYFLLFIFIIAATDVLNMTAISDLVMNAFNMIPKLLVGLVILIFGTLLADGIKNVVLAALDSLGIPSANLISSFLFYFLFINVVISAIAQADINTEFLEQNLSIVIAGLVAAFAIGYGLASKDMVANFLGSFYTQGKVKEGDIITIDGATGLVVEIDRNSLVMESEGKEIIIPLSLIIRQKLEINRNK